MNRIPLVVRRVQCVLVAALVGACGGSATTSGAEGGAGGTPGRSTHLAPGSWQMTAVTTPSAMNPGVNVCTDLQFTLNVSADGRATIGQDGRIDGTSAKIENDVYTLGGLNLPCETVTTLSGLTLRGTDTDGDGKADTLTGAGDGMAFSGGGDVQYAEAVKVALTGTPDVTAPKLLPPAPVNPLTVFAIAASEPLAATASLSLVGAPSVALTGWPEIASSDSVPLTSFIEWSTDVILPLSGTWSVQGTAQDLSGLALVPSGVLKTLTDPGIFARDGFEGPLVAASENGMPSIVTGVGSVPAITGAHSLWIAPGTTVTFHLERAKSEKTVHFAARAFGQGGPAFNANIRAAVVGGRKIVQPTDPLLPTQTPVDTGDVQWSQATAVTPFDLDLSEAGTDVLVQITPLTCFGFCEPEAALLIDDLTLE